MMCITENTTVNQLLDMAIEEIKNLINEEKFLVQELFKGYEWKRLPLGTRTTLGRTFLNYANGEGSNQLIPLGKTPNNQQIYKKKG